MLYYDIFTYKKREIERNVFVDTVYVVITSTRLVLRKDTPTINFFEGAQFQLVE